MSYIVEMNRNKHFFFNLFSKSIKTNDQTTKRYLFYHGTINTNVNTWKQLPQNLTYNQLIELDQE